MVNLKVTQPGVELFQTAGVGPSLTGTVTVASVTVTDGDRDAARYYNDDSLASHRD